MNILFLSIVDFDSIDERDLYPDLLREFRKHGHNLYILSPVERRKNQKTRIIKTNNVTILKVRTGNIQKTNIIEKGISTLLIEFQFTSAIKKYFSDVKFNLILYPTPPITFCNTIEFVKKRDNARTYLMLKDIFPQNAVDIGMLSTSGIKGILYKHFRNKEKKLYRISDTIGCMSRANVNYVIKHNQYIDPGKLEICPNSIEIADQSIDSETRIQIRQQYGIPLGSTVFVYGGNLGKPQGVEFIIECLKSEENNKEAFFLIVGNGTEYGKIDAHIKANQPANVKLIGRLDRSDYDRLVAACDIGMIFLDYRFTIPNFPSRLLGYLQAKLPVLACTDPNTDVGQTAIDGGFGWWCESNDVEAFKGNVDKIQNLDLTPYGQKGYEYLVANYAVQQTYDVIIKHFE